MGAKLRNKTQSQGTCSLCGGIYDRSVMSRHLKQCLVKRTRAEGVKPGSYASYKTDNQHIMHLGIVNLGYGTRKGDYWLHLSVRTDTTLHILDRFLRNHWLDCCDHLSQFTVGNVFFVSRSPFAYLYPPSPVNSSGDEDLNENEAKHFADEILEVSAFDYEEWSMDFAIGAVVKPQQKFAYEYDFGSTTALELRTMAMYRHAPQEEITILAQNNPPGITCVTCSAVPKWIFPASLQPEVAYCDECAKSRNDLFPVVNSPRNGVCAYGYVEGFDLE